MRRSSLLATAVFLFFASAGPATWPVSAQAVEAGRGVRRYALPQDTRATEGFDPAASAGLFVGIRQFEDPVFAEVPFAVDDAVDLAHLFALELDLIEPQRVVLSLAGQPEKSESARRLQALVGAGAIQEPASLVNIVDLLDRQTRASSEQGLLVVALATHGFSDQGGDFLVAEDTRKRRITLTGVPVNVLFDDVSRAKAPRRIVLLDACRERLSKDTRSSGATPGAAMSESLAGAIASAQGQVVLSGTTVGGYTYDDFRLKNGVFTRALIDGLRGQAVADDRYFITVRSLAEYVNSRVLAWIRDNRPGDESLSQGIEQRFEGLAADMPLAVDPGGLRVAREHRERRDRALDQLRQNLGDSITWTMFAEIGKALESDAPKAPLEELLAMIEALDGKAPLQRVLASYWQTNRAALLVSVPPPDEDAVAESPSGPATTDANLELALWNEVKDSDDVAELEAYRQRFPSGVFVQHVRERIGRLRHTASPPLGVTVLVLRPGGEALDPPWVDVIGGETCTLVIELRESAAADVLAQVEIRSGRELAGLPRRVPVPVGGRVEIPFQTPKVDQREVVEIEIRLGQSRIDLQLTLLP